MAESSAEQLAQRAFEVGLLDARQLESVWSDLGTRDVSADDMISVLVRKELLTNWQIERLAGNKRMGYFYGNYKVLYLVGAGTFARVYRAVHKDTDQVVAVKVLRQRYSDDMVKTEQFLREANTVKPLRHPNIVSVHDVQSERGRYYMVMDFVEGQNLRDWIKVRGKLPVDVSLRIIGDVAAGLDYAFKQGVTHRDIKLSNVLVSARGVSRLVDFGLAAIEGPVTDDTLANVPNARSIDYAALERATGVRKDDKRSDIYFVGCMLYHIVTGVSPLHETRDRIQRLNISRFQDVKPIAAIDPDLPQRVVILINKAMELKPDARYQTPGELLSDVQAVTRTVKESDYRPSSIDAETGEMPAAVEHVPVKLEGESRTLMIVESNTTIQNALRDPLKKLGYRVLIIGDPQRAMNRFEFDTTAAHCVIFSTGELGTAALDAFNKLGQEKQTKDLPAVLLVDKKQKRFVEAAQLAGHRRVISMPLRFRELRGTLRELLSAEKAGS